jgi:hypothetical protein
VWNRLFVDAPGLLLFLVWLALPPLYVLAVGRHYARRCRELYDLLRIHGCGCDCCLVEDGTRAERRPAQDTGVDHSTRVGVTARADERGGDVRTWWSWQRAAGDTTAWPALRDCVAACLPRSGAGRHRQRNDRATTLAEDHAGAPAVISG